MGNFTMDFPHRAADQQPQLEGSRSIILSQACADPQILHMDLWLGIQHHTAENAAEPKKVLIFQPGGTAVLVNLHTQPVPLFSDVGRQVKIGGCKAVLSIAHKLTVEPHKKGPFHPLKPDADEFSQQARCQIKGPDIASHTGMVPVNFRWAKLRSSIPGVQGVDVLDLPIALQLNMAWHWNGAKLRIVEALLPEVRRTKAGIPAPGKFPASVQGLIQRRNSLFQLLLCGIAQMVRMGIQPVDPEYLRVRKPIQICLGHGIFSFFFYISCSRQSK